MSEGEKVVFRFGRVREPRHLAVVCRIDKGRRASRDGFMRIGLVRYVEDDFIDGGVENAVQRHRELNDAEIGGYMAADGCRLREDRLAHLIAELEKLCCIEGFYVLRGDSAR